MAFRNIK